MKKMVILAIVICAGAAGAFAVWNYRNNGRKAAAETRTARVERGPIRLTVASTGRVVSNLDVEIKCKASGQILQLPFDISDAVTEGELLLELDPIDEDRNVKRAEVELSASEARLAQARLNLRTAEQQLVNDEQMAQANLRSAEAAEADAKAKADRMRRLLESERVSQEECETAETAATRAAVELENARIRLKELEVEREALKVKEQDVRLAETQKESDQIALDMAKQRLKETKVYVPISSAAETATTRPAVPPDNVRSRPKAMDGERGPLEGQRRGMGRPEGQRGSDRIPSNTARQRLKQTRPSAPTPWDDDTPTTPRWVVATRDVQIGQIISSPMNNVGGGTVLMTLSDLSRVFVIASVDESDIGQVTLGQRVIITADAFPNTFFSGKVERIATRGQSVSNVVTFEVKIEVFGEGKGKLKPEMTANVEIIVAENEDTLVLPAEAILRERGQRFVQMSGTNSTLGEKREVETGIDDGFQVEIAAGLEEGQEVIIPEGNIQSRWAAGQSERDQRRPGPPPGMIMRGMRRPGR